MTGPVICGIEDANGAGVADVARGLAGRYGLPLVYVHVLDGLGGAEQAATLLRAAAAPGGGELAIDRGHPADRLVELAAERGASFLVVGTHGSRSSLLGSISADVSRRAPCPVVVVPPTAVDSDVDDPAVAGGIARFDLGRSVRRVG